MDSTTHLHPLYSSKVSEIDRNRIISFFFRFDDIYIVVIGCIKS